MNNNEIIDTSENNDNNSFTKSKRLKSLKEKIAKNKNLEFTLAIVITLIAIVIYFSVNVIPINKEVGMQYDNSVAGQIAKTLSYIEGVGDCSVYITYKDSLETIQNSEKEIQGIIVVAQGGDIAKVQMKIIDAVSALIDVPGSNIKVYKMN